MAKTKSSTDKYPDDVFSDTRMSFGDHIEELRTRLFRALKWLIFFLIIGFVLDALGEILGKPDLGIGKPMLKVITEPVESQVRDFYNRRIEKLRGEKLTKMTSSTPDELKVIREKYEKNEFNLTALTADERQRLLGAPEKMPVLLPTEAFIPAFGPLKEGAPTEISFNLLVYPGYINYMSTKGDALIENKQHMSTLSVQEGFIVYFKVAILCSIVLASPFILFQFWAFVGAGLYPHEKRYVYLLFGPSVVLFLFGVLLCQFFVLPGAVKALLAFNEWLGFDPEIRLREWLGLAVILPLVFGVSFQTPLVMIFLNRIGVFTAYDYLAYWKASIMVLALFSALITPTPDIVTMLYLFTPMFGLYLAGIGICYVFPGGLAEDAKTEAAEEVAV